MISMWLSVGEQRLRLATDLVRAWAPASLVDLGCGDAKAISRIVASLAQPPRAIVGVDLSTRALRRGGKAIAKALAPPAPDAEAAASSSSSAAAAPLVALYEGTFEGLVGVRAEAVIMIEVVEHLDPAPLAKLGDVLFGELRPTHVLVTTPNSEYNSVWYPKLPPEKCPLRNNDHRFEWTRAEFKAWAEGLAALHGYDVRFEGAGGGPFDAMKPAPAPSNRTS